MLGTSAVGSAPSLQDWVGEAAQILASCWVPGVSGQGWENLPCLLVSGSPWLVLVLGEIGWVTQEGDAASSLGGQEAGVGH